MAGTPQVALALTTTMTVAIHDSHHVVVTSPKVGVTMHAAVSLSGLPAPTGTVAISQFSGATCTGRFVISKPVTLVGGRADVTGFTFLPTTVGTYSFGAAYSPAPGSPYLAAHACKSFTVARATPGLTLAFQLLDDGSAITSVELGQRFKVVATATGPAGVPEPSGAATIRRFSDAGCTAQVWIGSGDLSNGTLSFVEQRVVLGTLWYKAAYAGDGRYTTASTSCRRLDVVKATPSVNSAIHDPGHVTVTTVVVGTAVHAFVRVRGFSAQQFHGELIPTGQVRGTWFSDGACTTVDAMFGPLTLDTGQADIIESTRVLAPGAHSLRVQYMGNGSYKGVLGPCLRLTVATATPTAAPPTAQPAATPVAPVATPAATLVTPSPSAAPAETVPTSIATATPEVTTAPTALAPSAAASPAASPASPSTGAASLVEPLVLVVGAFLVIGAIVVGFVFGRRRGGRPGPAG